MPSLSSSACAARLRAARRAARSPPVRVLRVRAGAEEDALLPPPQVKRFSRKAERRIAREGPRESDLRDEVGRIPKECLPPPADTSPPNWRALRHISYGELMAAVRSGAAAEVELWSDRDPSVYWPPWPVHQPFSGKRALVRLRDGDTVVADLPLAEMERVATNALVASTRVETSFHQPPGREGFTDTDLGLIAIAGAQRRAQAAPDAAAAVTRTPPGGLFMLVSIYLGLTRKAGIPSDLIQAMEFGQSKAKSRVEGRTGVRFADVAGLGTIIAELQEVVAFLRDPKRFVAVGARPPRGLLLEGGPGVGKTLVAKAIAGEAGVPFYAMAGSEFVEVIVGVGAARVRDLFRRARVNAPCIIFVDEIDALGGRRAPASARGGEEREQTLNQLLTEMDGFTAETGVIFVGATNRADLLDPALTRPGRFDRTVTVRPPDAGARAECLRIAAAVRKVPLAPDVDLPAVARSLPGFSGADCANLVNTAALIAVRRGGEDVSAEDVAAAADRLRLGPSGPHPRAGALASRLALHEAGHAVVSALLLPGSVERVSVAPAGGEPSRTLWRRAHEAAAAQPTARDVAARLRVLLAGGSAEVACTGSRSQLGASDLADASTLARRATAAAGLGPALPGFAWDGDFGGPLAARLDVQLPPGGGTGRPLASPLLQQAEEAVVTMLRHAEGANARLLAARRGALDAVAAALLDRGQLTGAELQQLLDSHPPAQGREADGLPEPADRGKGMLALV